jgi:hypothetical protein
MLTATAEQDAEHGGGGDETHGGEGREESRNRQARVVMPKLGRIDRMKPAADDQQIEG